MIIRHHEENQIQIRCLILSFPEMCCSPHPCLVMSKRVPFLMKKWQNSGGKYLINGVGTEQAGTLMGNQSGNECSKVGHVATNNLKVYVKQGCK